MKITIGLTQSDRENGYVSFVDGYREGTAQDIISFETNSFDGYDDVDLAELVFEATNNPTPTGDEFLMLCNIVSASGTRRRSLSTGDTVSIDGHRFACESIGWKEL